MAVSFYPPIASADQFPPVQYSAVPRLKLSELNLSSLLALPEVTFTKSGGTALALAGQQLIRDGNNTLLAPAYHCPAAIEPFMWLGYNILFYRVNEDLTPNLDDIKRLLAEHQVTHCLMIRFFGFEQSCNHLLSLMAENDIDVIEDAAHSIFHFINTLNNNHVAIKATICSVNKMLPSIDGGMLYLPNHLGNRLKQVKLWRELKGLAYSLGIMAKINHWRQPINGSKTVAKKSGNINYQEGYRYFKPSFVNLGCFRHTKYLVEHSRLDKIKETRRSNYLYLREQLKDCTSGKLLFEQIGNEDVPYIFPFLLNSDIGFSKLREQGIQSLRWEEIAESDCSVSQHYRTHLVQIPCHQQLSKQALDDIIHQIKSI